MTGIRAVGYILLEVPDVLAAADFYERLLGAAPKLRDGNRFAAFAVGDTLLALAPPAIAAAESVVCFRVDDVEAWTAAAAAVGVELGEVEQGPHEKLVRFRDPSGHQLMADEWVKAVSRFYK